MKRAIIISMLLVLCGAAWAGEPNVSSNTLQRICDGIGRQYGCVSANMKNQYGFGGSADTLTSDTTVQRGCQMNIHRVKETNDAALAELLPAFLSTQTQLDSLYMYGKWSSICWAINNAFSDSGGLSATLQSRATVDGTYRLSPRFARVARANGIYVSPKSVYSDSLNFGVGVITSGGAYAYSDSNAIDTTLYGPNGLTQGRVCVKVSGASGTGACTLQVWGSNQNLNHGRRWIKYITEATSAASTLAADVAGDSIYNIDSSKIKAYTGTLGASVLYYSRPDRADSL